MFIHFIFYQLIVRVDISRSVELVACVHILNVYTLHTDVDVLCVIVLNHYTPLRMKCKELMSIQCIIYFITFKFTILNFVSFEL